MTERCNDSSATKSLVQPPMQNPAGFYVLDYANPTATPYYRFAVAELTDPGNIKITISIPGPAQIKEEEVSLFESVEQTYSVMVPYTELVDGNPVTRTRTEQRVRNIPVRRATPGPDGSEGQVFEETYTVMIPYTETTSKGVVQKMRQETRTQRGPTPYMQVEMVPSITSSTYAIEDVKCFLPTGEPLPADEIDTRLIEPLPVIVVSNVCHICDYFGKLMQPDCLIIVQPEKKQKLRAHN